MKTYNRLLIISLALAGQLVGTFPLVLADNETPPPDVKLNATQWRSLAPEDYAGKAELAFPNQDWWKAFHDPHLNALVEKALADNPNLHKIEEQINAAQQMAKAYRSAMFPAFSLGPQMNYQQYSREQFLFPIQSRTYQSFQVPLNVSYQVDLLGKNWTTYKSAKKSVDVAQYQYEASKILLASEVATTYINIAKFRHLEALAQEQVETSRQLLDHSQQLLDLGQATTFDLQDRQLRLDQAQVDLSILAGNRQVAENQLEALLGTSPTENTARDITEWALLHWSGDIFAGVPSELLTRRPDVAIAEAQLEAARLNVSAARKALLPSINLTGSSGYNAIGITNLFKASNISSFLIGSLLQPVFTGGRLRAELNLRKSNYAQMLSAYQDTLIHAYTDVENSLALIQTNTIAYRALEQQTARVADIASKEKDKMDAGVSSAPLWLAQESQRIDYEKALAQQKAQMMIDYIGLSKALGGGFNANLSHSTSKESN